MFALGARSFSQLSETFIRVHAERIAPGNSAFVCFDNAPQAPLPGPLLSAANRRAQLSNSVQVAPVARMMSWLAPIRHHAVASFLRAHGVDCMMAEFGPFGYRLMPAALKAGARYYVHFHGWDASRALRDPRVVKRYQDLFQKADGFFAPSQFIADNLISIGCPANAITVTPCGIDPEKFSLSSRAPKRMLAVGRFVEKKAPQVTVAAFAKIAARHKDAHLDFVGEGKLLETCKGIVASHGLENQVTFHGGQSHGRVQELMSQASIFLQHSVTAKSGDTEGLPVSILEAMCSGHCVISTRHSGIPEAVIDRVSGLLTDEYDVDAMAIAMDTALSDEAMVATFGLAARDRATAHFSANRSVARLQKAMDL